MAERLTRLELKEFNLLQDLGAVLRRHNAQLTYTKADDGVHLVIDGVTLTTGYWSTSDMSDRTMDLAKKTYDL